MTKNLDVGKAQAHGRNLGDEQVCPLVMVEN
jgi:hypothetical protein